MRRALLFLCLVAVPVTASAQPATKVILNGVPTPVYFNDGDSFRVLDGKLKGTKARLAGFNTLESYGNVHQWGTWTRAELARYATLGTLNARRGVWTCDGDLDDKDTYGRVLFHCPDLVDSQVRQGLAHVMVVGDDVANPKYLAAQHEAIKHRRGMWAHGVPDYVMTSLHSASEGFGARNYNRLVSTKDGRSKKWLHQNDYAECQTICEPTDFPDRPRVEAFVKELRANHPELYEPFSDEALFAMITEMAKDGRILVKLPPGVTRWKVEYPISRGVTSGRLTTSGKPTSCVVYAEFKRRYGAGAAECLK